MQFVRKCNICDKLFVAQRKNASFCSYECKKVNCINYNKKQKEIEKAKRAEKRNKIPHKYLLDIDKAAKLAGMTYGQYVAKMGL